ncbi:MAG TPA: sensor histidine kinase, partial [Ferruginibacter sp.]|nr:sensor histidine kinase [Ferruginibacter sp.]
YNGLYSICMFFITFIFAYHANVPGYWYSHFVSYFWLLLLDLGTIFYVQFTRKFLPTAKNSFVDQLLKVEMFALALLIVVYSIVHFYTPWVMLDAFLENAMKLTVVIINFIYIVLGLENKSRLMNYLAFGNGIQVIFAILALSLLGPSTQTTELYKSSLFYFETGVIISQVFFFLGLAYKQRLQLIEGVRFREKMLRNEEKLKYEAQVAVLEAQQAERQRISIDMHDDLGAGVTSIRLFSELAKKKLNGLTIPEIDKVSAFANELLVNMNAIIWSMSGQNDHLDNMVAYIRSYALEYGENVGLDVIIDSPGHIPTIPIKGEVRRNIFLTVKEALHNVVKHAQATQVCIRIQYTDTGICIEIQDNGVGINPDKIRQFGNGLKNMQKRMETIGGSFEIDNQNGTTIRLCRN